MLRCVLAFLAAALFGAAAVPGALAAAPDNQLKFGLTVNSQGWGDQVGQQQDHAVALGVGQIRESIEWAQVNPAPGVWSWSHYDRLMEQAAQRGLTVLPVLWGTPDWAGTRGFTGPPTDNSTFAEYVHRTVARYGPNGAFWAARPNLAKRAPTNFEIWNEPYYPYFWGGHYDPQAFAKLFRAGSIAGKQADTSVKFLLPIEHTGRDDNGRYVGWVDDLYASVPDLNDYFDKAAVHPYSNDLTTPPTDSRQHRVFRRIETLRRLLSDRGAGDKPFWLTEIGWSTCDPNADSACVSEQKQAEMVDQLFGLLTTQYPWVEAAFVYHINSWGAPEDRSDREHWFGVLRQDGSRKPVWDVIHDWATRDPLASPTPVDDARDRSPAPGPLPSPSPVPTTPAPVPTAAPIPTTPAPVPTAAPIPTTPAPVPTAAPIPTTPAPIPSSGGADDEAIAQPTKLEIARAQVLRVGRVLDVLAPISRRASGNVEVQFQAGGRRTAFNAPVDRERGQVRIEQAITAAQARPGTGIITLRYEGNGRTHPQEVRLRAALRPAKLEAQRPHLDLDAGVVTTRGTVTHLARGVVRLQLVWSAGGEPRTIELQAPIHDGRFRLADELPTEALDSIARRDGTLHSYTMFTGYLKTRVRGEMKAYQVLDAR